ncbi:Regulatory protein NPR1 [Citrus sinensis]|nr:Regulatory protein NPR1 [Citrus sinensis]
MENANEMSASLSFVSSYPSCWSTNQPTGSETCSDLDNLNLRRQSKPLLDAEIVVDGKSVADQFLHWLCKLRNDGSVSEGKPKYLMTDLVPYGKVGYEAFNDILHYLYTGKVKPSPLVVSTCVDDACAPDACPPAVNYAIELMYASAAFQMKELVLLLQKAVVEDVIPILMAALHCHLNQLRSLCIQRVEVSSEIKSIRIKFHQEFEDNTAEVDPVHAKRVRRIHKALDSDDFELLNLLLNEYEVTLDDAYALHYAAAYCSPNVFVEVLNMGLADLNLKDARGHTVLHVAARRKEPAVLLAQLSKGACASETKSDGQTAVAICRRMTRRKDYTEASKQGQEINKDRLCIDVLDNFMSGNLTMSSEVMDDDFQLAFARLLFPSEARITIGIAGADTTNFNTGFSALNPIGLSWNLKEVDLSETPLAFAELFVIAVERGRRYFPHCSEVVDKFLDCDWLDASLLESDALEEQKLKRARLIELEEDVQEAFCKDMAYDNRSGLPSSSSAFYDYMAENNRSGMPTSSASSN